MRPPEVEKWLKLSNAVKEQIGIVSDTLQRCAELTQKKLTVLNSMPHTFADHLHPIVAITLATDLRREEVLSLCWSDFS